MTCASTRPRTAACVELALLGDPGPPAGRRTGTDVGVEPAAAGASRRRAAPPTRPRRRSRRSPPCAGRRPRAGPGCPWPGSNRRSTARRSPHRLPRAAGGTTSGRRTPAPTSEEPTTAPRALVTNDPSAVDGTTRADPPDHDRVGDAEDERHDDEQSQPRPTPGGGGGHVSRSRGCGDEEVEQLDPDERGDDAAEAVDPEVAREQRARARRLGSARRAGASGMSATMMSALKTTADRIAELGSRGA